MLSSSAMFSSSINFTADLEPVPFKRVMQNGKRRFNDRRYSEFKDALGTLAKCAMHGQAPLSGFVKLRADFFKLKPKNISSRSWGDVDNFLKAVMDALNGIAYHDDSQVVQAIATKNFGEPKIFIELEEFANEIYQDARQFGDD